MSKFPFGRCIAFHFYTQSLNDANTLRYHFQKLLKPGKFRYKTTPPVEEEFYQAEHTTQIAASHSVSIYVVLPSTDPRVPRLIEYCQELTAQKRWILGLDIDGYHLDQDRLHEPVEDPDCESY